MPATTLELRVRGLRRTNFFLRCVRFAAAALPTFASRPLVRWALWFAATRLVRIEPVRP